MIGNPHIHKFRCGVMPSSRPNGMLQVLRPCYHDPGGRHRAANERENRLRDTPRVGASIRAENPLVPRTK